MVEFFHLILYIFIIAMVALVLALISLVMQAFGTNSTANGNMTLDCIRMFFSDDWDKGYVVDLAKYCAGAR